MTVNNERKVIELEQGWAFLQKGITKVKNFVEGITDQQISSEEYMSLYITVYNMCSFQAPQDYSQQLYDRYRESIVEYINSMVLPALRELDDEFLLRVCDAMGQSQNHGAVVVTFIPRRSLPALKKVGLMCFRDLIDREHEGEQIDRALLKNVLDIFVEIGMDAYETDFESSMLQDTAAYYSRKAASWIEEDPSADYMLKAEECLRREKERVGHYLHASSEQKLLEKVQHELIITQYENRHL